MSDYASILGAVVSVFMIFHIMHVHRIGKSVTIHDKKIILIDIFDTAMVFLTLVFSVLNFLMGNPINILVSGCLLVLLVINDLVSFRAMKSIIERSMRGKR